MRADRRPYILSYEPVNPMAFLHQAYTPRCCIWLPKSLTVSLSKSPLRFICSASGVLSRRTAAVRETSW